MPQLCPELTTKLESLKTLKQQFDLEFIKIKKLGSKKSNDLISIRDFKAKLNQTLQDLQNELWLETPELTQENLKVQYEFQKDVLIKAGLLKTLSTGELGIKAINNKEYPIPTLEQIEEMMLEKPEFFKTKINQGFIKLIMVPFGLPISSLIEAYDKALMEHHQRGELLDTQNKPLGLNKEIGKKFIDDDQAKHYVQAEATGDLVYFPQKFSKTAHQGKTKQELLSTQAWQVLLLEDLPNLPDQGQGKIIANREQPEASRSPNSYLKQLQIDLQYEGEQGLTPESWLVYALNHLAQTNKVIGSGESKYGYMGCFLLNSFFKESGSVPGTYFRCGSAQVDLDQYAPNHPYSNYAGRFLVSII
ncbi:MAG: hypothetical protein WCW02_02985 [Candidatus Buchananbacteria bacterium]